jgi:hypothetical protein
MAAISTIQKKTHFWRNFILFSLDFLDKSKNWREFFTIRKKNIFVARIFLIFSRLLGQVQNGGNFCNSFLWREFRPKSLEFGAKFSDRLLPVGHDHVLAVAHRGHLRPVEGAWDRCYDFKNIYAQKLGSFLLRLLLLLAKIGSLHWFLRKTPFFRVYEVRFGRFFLKTIYVPVMRMVLSTMANLWCICTSHEDGVVDNGKLVVHEVLLRLRPHERPCLAKSADLGSMF